ncbi:AMP-binding protein [Corynebacterium sp.]|uniref:AMP-binding protein n=1 Tax=Corynebacterium sp. TaxID=1720 RepID=UPI0026DD0292|nr:AMP-binding protein [Corynebacterium sp.]MDO4610594.1 AMP-binding protein [Corynebacterium sp.]
MDNSQRAPVDDWPDGPGPGETAEVEARGRLARLLDALSIPPGYAVAIRDLVPHVHRATLAELWDRDLVPVILDPHLPGALRDDLLAELRPAAVVRWTAGEEAGAAGEGAGAGGAGTDAGGVPPAAVRPCAEQPASRDTWRRFDAPDPDDGPGAPDPGTPDSGDAVAYVAYTSGSTGRPKGAVIGRRAFDSFVTSTCELYELGPQDRRLLLSNPAFDLAMEQVGTSLHAGCALVPAGDGLVATDPASLAAEVTRHSITVLSLPTGVFNAVGAAMAADGAAAAAFRDAPVRLVMAGGEAPDRAAIRGWVRALPGARLLNGYGPTECTVVTSYGEMTPDGPVTVGRPLPGVTYELRDGELIIGGVQVGRGYVHGAAGGFEPGGDRRYATGDGARMLPDGRWVIEGRRDRMIKVSGYRVDPAVVEEAVASADGVAAAHAVLVDGALGCLLVPDASAAGDERGAAVMGRVRDRCRAALPRTRCRACWPSPTPSR